MTPIGLRGAPCGVIDDAGIARLHAHKQPMTWWVAASDKWHDPRQAPSLRQRRIDGVPVVETKLAVPGGDVVQRGFVVADQGGALVYEFENRSPSAVIVAVSMRHASTSAASAGTTPQGADLGDGVRAFPLAHASTVRFAWALERSRWRRKRSLDVASLAASDAVVRGWVQSCDRASRVTTAGNDLRSARCSLLLADVRDIDDLIRTNAALGVLAVGERVRMGDPVGSWVASVADAAQRVARKPGESAWSWRALSVAAHLLTMADEQDGASDVVSAWQRSLDQGAAARPPRSAVAAPPLEKSAEFAALVEDRLARPVSPLVTHLFADGLRDSRGTNFEAHGIHAGPHHRLSFALRWHGENAALLWELDGPPGLQLTAPDVDPQFNATAQQGEALLRMAD